MTGKYPERFIYLDHNATTQVDRDAVKAMMPYLEDTFGNPSSGYGIGVRAKEGLERAREDVAQLLGCQHHEIIFTSGGSESNNMVLKGVIELKHPEKSGCKNYRADRLLFYPAAATCHL